MRLRGLFHLVTARLLGNPMTLIVGLACLGLGPLLVTFQRWAPVSDAGSSLAPGWIQLLTLAGASGAVWAVSASRTTRRLATQPERVLEDALVVAAVAALASFLAAGSLLGASLPLPAGIVWLAPLKLGALGALGLAWGGGRASVALLTLWTAVWILPQWSGSLVAGVLGLPLEPRPGTQVLASAGLLLAGLASTWARDRITPSPSST